MAQQISQTPPPVQSAIPNVRNPNLFPEPNSIKRPDLYKYVSTDTIKLRQSYKNYKRAGPYLLGILGGCFVASFLVNKFQKKYVFGNYGNGGNVLNMYTQGSNDDYYYNREFQRMRYLTEEPFGNDANAKPRDEMLADLGIPVRNRGNNLNIRKKSPHYKYFY